MTNLSGAIGEVAFTIQVTRKETGLVEEYQMVGVVTDGETEKAILDLCDKPSETTDGDKSWP